MNKTASVFVVAATIAGSLTATPASAQRGITPAAPDRYWPAPYGASPVPTTILAVANG